MLDQVRKAVFFGAHTDDEMVCAGTLHRLTHNGCAVRIVTFGPAATEKDRVANEESFEIVKKEWENSIRTISHFAEGTLHRYMPSASLVAERQKICQHVFDFCETMKPDAAFILSRNDQETTHAMLGEECERVMRGRVPFILRCQMPWGCPNDRPNLYVTLSPEDVEAKRKVIQCYKSQAFRYNYLDLLLAKARADGLTVKAEYAEVFEIVRGVI